MINFDSLTLKLFAEENKNFFVGAKVQKIQQPNRSELIFFVRNSGISKKFYINFNPNFYHICFMSEENEKKRSITIPKTAPMFCMLLRKYILNARILNIEVPANERIFEIYFEYYDELNEKSKLCLAIELMGKYSNVILYNYDNNVIIGCAHNVSSKKSRERELSGLMPYIYPPKQKKKDLTRVTKESFINSLDESDIIRSISSKYNYITMPVAEMFYKSIKPFSTDTLYEKLKLYLLQKDYKYYIANDFSKYFLFDFKDSFECKSVNELIDTYYSYQQSLIITDNIRQKIIKYINSQLKKLNLLKQKQNEQIVKLDKAIEYKNKGDILMANSYSLKNIQNEVVLYDFEGKEISISLDINCSVIENANKYYSLYKKTKASYEHAKLMIEDTNSQIMYFEEQRFYAQNTTCLNDLKEIYSDLFDNGASEKEKNFKVDYVDYKGYRIYIGKNKKQNDYILSKIASGEDLWFHPLNAAGAHILVRIDNKNIVPDDILIKAAEITKEYSSQKENSKTSIIYTKRKYVKKANNKIAFVTYKNEVEIIV